MNVPGPRFGVASPEVTEGLQKTADRLLPRANSARVPGGANERENNSAANRASRQGTEWADEGSRRGGRAADAGLQKGTDMRRATILHALNLPAACPLISPTRTRVGILRGRGR